MSIVGEVMVKIKVACFFLGHGVYINTQNTLSAVIV